MTFSTVMLSSVKTQMRGDRVALGEERWYWGGHAICLKKMKEKVMEMYARRGKTNKTENNGNSKLYWSQKSHPGKSDEPVHRGQRQTNA